MKMKIYCLVAFLALSCPGPLVRAQSTDDGRSPAVCTDLTGKVPLPCPRSDDNVALPTDDDSAPAKPAANPELGAKRAAGGKSNSEVTTAPMATAASPTTRLAKPQSGTATGSPAGVSGAHSSVRPTSLPESIGSEGDPRANIGLSPKTAPEPEPVAVEAVTPVVTRPKSLERNFIR